MKFDDIVKAIEANRVNITLHARKEAKEVKIDDISFQPSMAKLLKTIPMIFHIRAS